MNIYKKITSTDLFKASSLNSLTIIVRIITGVLSSKAIAYFVGPSGMALIGNFRSFISTFESIGTLGLQNGIIKTVAQQENDKLKSDTTVKFLFWIFVLISIIASIIILSFSDYFSQKLFFNLKYSHVIQVFALYLPFNVLFIYFISVLNGLSLFKKITTITIISYVFSLILSVALMWKFSIFGALISISFGSLFSFIISGIYFFKIFSFQTIFTFEKFNFLIVKDLLSYSAMTLFSAIISPILIIFIRNLIIEKESINIAGYYEAITRISGFYMIFISSLMTFYFLPELSKSSSIKKTKELFWSYYKGIIPIFIFGLVCIFLLKDIIISILFTKEFQPVSNLFFYQLLGDFFKACAIILGMNFYAKKLVKAYFVTEIISFVVLFASSFLLINKFGVEGSVMAYSVTYFIYFLILVTYFRKSLFKNE